MKTVLLINGPPRSGKTTTAKIIAERRADAVVMGFADHLKRCVHAIHLGFAGWFTPLHEFDPMKDDRQKFLEGRTWREEYIHFSENYIKPRFGRKWFGEKLLFSALSQPQPLIIIHDSGFPEEVEPLIGCPEIDQIHLIQLYREGTDFDGDSRGYINLDHFGISPNKLFNRGSLYALSNSTTFLLEAILK